ncbi:MAG: S4 domain-containing protein, partial [Gammaproteobacteria bacterium]
MTEKIAVKQAVVGEDDAGTRLDRFLGRQYPGVPRTRLFRIVRKGEVRVNGKRAAIDTRLASGDTVRLPPVRVEAPGDEAGEGGGAAA